MDLRSLINGKNGTAPAAEQPRLSKEEYSTQKQAEREAVWARVDTQTEAVLGSGEALKDFLDFFAKCNPQRTANLLLLHEQNADATQVKTFEVTGTGENIGKVQAAQAATHAAPEKSTEAPSVKSAKAKNAKQHDAR